jgi:hypothetical protein
VPVKKGFSAALPPGGTALEFGCVAHFKAWRKSAFLRTGGCDEYAKATALERRNGDARAVRRALEHA